MSFLFPARAVSSFFWRLVSSCVFRCVFVIRRDLNGKRFPGSRSHADAFQLIQYRIKIPKTRRKKHLTTTFYQQYETFVSIIELKIKRGNPMRRQSCREKALLSLIPIALKGPYNTDRALLFQKLSIPLFFSGIRSDVHYVHHERMFILRRRDFQEAKTGAIRFAAGPPRKHRDVFFSLPLRGYLHFIHRMA